MADDSSYVETLIKLRAQLIQKRRSCAQDARSADLPQIVAEIEAVDRSIIDERTLSEIV